MVLTTAEYTLWVEKLLIALKRALFDAKAHATITNSYNGGTGVATITITAKP
jgi:hypothetical protein